MVFFFSGHPTTMFCPCLEILYLRCLLGWVFCVSGDWSWMPHDFEKDRKQSPSGMTST